MLVVCSRSPVTFQMLRVLSVSASAGTGMTVASALSAATSANRATNRATAV